MGPVPAAASLLALVCWRTLPPMSETWTIATVVLAAVIVVLALLLAWRRL